MFFQIIFDSFWETFSPANDHALILSTLSFLFTSVLFWRIWNFSILPLSYPHDPKELPYWIPLVGHIFPFISDSQKLFAYAENYFGNTKEPFAISAGGKKFYIITRSKDVGEAYRNQRLSFNIFAQNLMRSCGTSESCIKIMHATADSSTRFQPRKKDLAATLREMQAHQLAPGENLDYLTARFNESFSAHLHLQTLKNECPYAVTGEDGGVRLPLGHWIADVFIRAGERSYFGQRMVELDPELKWAFLKFDNLSYQISYQYPRYLAQEAHRNLDRIISVMNSFFNLPQEERTGAAWVIKDMENEFRKVGIDTHDISTIMLFMYWSLNSNIHQACFWLLAYVLEDAGLLEAIRTEIEAAFIPDHDRLDLHHLDGRCPRLQAAINEMLRVTANSISARELTDDAIIGGKHLRKGNLVLIPHRILHYDESVFGDRVTEFDSLRFLKHDGMERSNSWKPFGGGSSMCPGRFLLKRVVMVFVALLLHRFEVTKERGQSFPQQRKTPRAGLARNSDFGEVWVHIKTRAT